jgi:DDE family transposase/transposase IS4-like protein
MSSSTPFFKAFGPLLFGRKPGGKLKELKQIQSLGELYEVFGDLIPEKLLGRSQSGTNSRERALPPRVTFWAFVWQVMQPQSSCREVVRKIEAWWRWMQKDRSGMPALSASAYCQARSRLSSETLELILSHSAHNLERHVLSQEEGPAGRRVRIVDGTGVSMPDTPSNQSCWPQPSAQKPGQGFPVAKLVGLFSLSSGALLEQEVGRLREHDSLLLTRLMGKIRKGDIVLADRAFCSYAALATLVARGADGLMRLHQARPADLRRGKVLGPLDRVVVWSRPLQCPPGCDRETFETLPQTLAVRLIGLRVKVPGFRSRSITLVTTLTDPMIYPANELRELYAKRWNVELHFHQIKIALGMDILRCQSPEMIEKEILIHFIAYNLIRAFMQRAAHIHHSDLLRMSFKGALDTSRHFASAIHAASSTPRKQDALLAQMLAAIAFDPVPLRPHRSEPRVKKRRPKNYRLLTKPRHQMKLTQHRNRWRAKSPKPVLT